MFVSYIQLAWGSNQRLDFLFRLYNSILVIICARTVRGQSEFSPQTLSEDSPRVLQVLGLSSDFLRTVLGLNSARNFKFGWSISQKWSEFSPSGVLGLSLDSARNTWGRVKTSLQVCSRF